MIFFDLKENNNFKKVIMASVLVAIILGIAMKVNVQEGITFKIKSGSDFKAISQNIFDVLKPSEQRKFAENLNYVSAFYKNSPNQFKQFDGMDANAFNSHVYLLKKSNIEKQLTDLEYKIAYETHLMNGLLELRKPLYKLETEQDIYKKNTIQFILSNNSDQELSSIKIHARLIHKETNLPWVAQSFDYSLSQPIKPFNKQHIQISDNLSEAWSHPMILSKSMKLHITLLNAQTSNDEQYVPKLGKYNENYIKNMKSKIKYLKLEMNNLIKARVEENKFKLFSMR